EKWACRKCTFLNPENNLSNICAMCNTRRESTRDSNNKLSRRKKKKNEDGGDSSHSHHHHASSTIDNDMIDGGPEIQQKRSSSKKQQSTKKPKHENGSTTAQNNSKGKASANTSSSKASRKSDKKKNQSLWKWASSSASQSLSQQTTTFSRSASSNNKKSKLSSSATTAQQQQSFKKKHSSKTTNNTEMWIDKHAPRTTKELCIAPKKIEEVKTFLSSHVSYTQSLRKQQQQHNDNTTNQHQQSNKPWEMPSTITDNPVIAPQTKLMILVGSPGVGKSTMVRTLANETKIEILTWNDAHIDYNMQQASSDYSNNMGGGGGYLPYQSQLNSFEEFLSQGGVGMESLDVMGDFMDTTSSLEEDGRVGKREEEEEKKDEYAGSLILVEEIPNLYNAEAAQSFRNIMERHIQRTQTPTFFIFSDVHEGKHKPEDLERLIPSNILYSPLVQILPIQPVTKAKMKKCLQSIAKAEGLGKNSLSADFFEETHLSSGGDLRHAIFAMQFRCCSSSAQATITSSSNNNNGNSAKKDKKMSTFHALGKLLYAKRKPRVQYDSDDDLDDGLSSSSAPALARTKWDDGRGPLDFAPDEVLNNIDMGVGSAISFLSYHSPDFFTDVTDLSRSFDLLSDATTFLDRFGQTEGPFPMEYASCIGGRAVADGNKNPAPPQFRQFSTPKVFSVVKKNRENETKIEHLRKRLSSGGGGQRTSIHDNIGSAQQFVTDSLPYMRAVIPQGKLYVLPRLVIVCLFEVSLPEFRLIPCPLCTDVNYALANLHSYANDSNGKALDEPYFLEEENKVLLEDDLIDDDEW
ncbi:hypothetical protein ACHAXR_006427, partial [Thalassiosira sp. AJA248-18]